MLEEFLEKQDIVQIKYSWGFVLLHYWHNFIKKQKVQQQNAT